MLCVNMLCVLCHSCVWVYVYVSCVCICCVCVLRAPSGGRPSKAVAVASIAKDTLLRAAMSKAHKIHPRIASDASLNVRGPRLTYRHLDMARLLYDLRARIQNAYDNGFTALRLADKLVDKRCGRNPRAGQGIAVSKPSFPQTK